MKKRENFSSKLGFILSCAGAAIGLGNVWMFSWRLGEYGGAAFLIPYFIFVYFLGTTGLITEIAFGRKYQKGALSAIKTVFKEKNLKFGSLLGSIPLAAMTGIFIFYIVVVGWIFRYFYASLINIFQTIDIPTYFGSFAGSIATVPWTILGMIATVFILCMGIGSGVEKINKVIMPGLFILFVVLLIKSLTLPNAIAGVKYLLMPNFSYLLKPITWVMALGQAFFSVSLSGAGMVVYGSYLKEDIDIPSSARSIVIFDTLAALMAAFIIIPAAFSFGLDPAAGPPLLFITVPKIFTQMTGGYIFSIIFFLSIVFAAISSAINMMEAPIEALIEEFHLSRKKATILIGLICLCISILLSINIDLFGAWADFMSIYLAPIGASISAFVFYWICGKTKALEAINLGAKTPLKNSFLILGKYIYILVAVFIVILGAIYGGIG
ncbi:sodium-dependent transporter [Crassaminicella indica]|uniref:Sodium-dependent transporter n=1 Tax=Crassaminicella indica TaxID=2855394 RepID=A0ABX8RD13_9CLOT|nr:sodium-dependent transporter [Crassaminicella indica]QXM06187.1 sodium-dependent transporter [Crassaminicella indica]